MGNLIQFIGTGGSCERFILLLRR